MTDKIAILWFRQDLRLSDNPALLHAVQNGYRILPVFILDDNSSGEWSMGGASRWWLHESLSALNASLGNRMVFRKGDARRIIPSLIENTKAQTVFWNRLYEPWSIARDKEIKADLKAKSITAETFNSHLLWEPWEVTKDDGTPYKVFTPYYRKGCLDRGEPMDAQPAPVQIHYADVKDPSRLDDLGLLPTIDWYEGMQRTWEPGEAGAKKRLLNFLDHGIHGYKENRNRPDMENVSRLSPHLHFGEISPRTVWHTAKARIMDGTPEKDIDHFCSELGWREFSHALLYYNPELPKTPLQPKFTDFPWNDDLSLLPAWQKGQTGIPIIDAGMRQLWSTGWMHNRVRMIVGSFLVKNMLLHWHHGEAWFWDTLVDADLANNAASWQWIAGCGADAAPYFRIFNPITQGEKFDPDGTYVCTYVPELADMPKEYIHRPWEAPPLSLQSAGVTLGKNYPHPIVELKATRERALAAFQSLKQN